MIALKSDLIDNYVLNSKHLLNDSLLREIDGVLVKECLVLSS